VAIHFFDVNTCDQFLLMRHI